MTFDQDGAPMLHVSYLRQHGIVRQTRQLALDQVQKYRSDAMPPAELAIVLDWIDRAHECLAWGDKDGQNAWYRFRDERSTVSEYLVDIRAAIELSQLVLANTWGSTHKSYGLQLRYALINGSIRSLATNVQPALMLALVNHEIWRIDQGLAYATQITEPIQRAQVLALLLAMTAEAEREAVARDTLAAIVAIRSDDPMARILGHVAPFVPQSLLSQMLNVAQQVERPTQRVRALAACAPFLDEPDLGIAIEDALRAARAISHRETYYEALARIAPLLPPERRAELPEEARAESDAPTAEIRAIALLEGPDNVGDSLEPIVLLAAIRLVQAEPNPQDRLRALLRLVPRVPLYLLEQWGEALPTTFSAERAADIARSLPTSSLERALALAAVATRAGGELAEMLADEALEMGGWYADGLERAHLIAVAMPCLSSERKKEATAEALALVEDARREQPRDPPEEFGFDFTSRNTYAMQQMGWEENVGARARALAELSYHLPEPERSTLAAMALAVVHEIKDDEGEEEAQRALTPAVEDRAKVLAQVALLLPEEQQDAVLAATLDRIEGLTGRKVTRQIILDTLAPGLPRRWLRRALRISQTIDDEQARRSTAAQLAVTPSLLSRLPKPLLTSLGVAKLRSALDLADSQQRHSELATIVSALPVELLEEVIATSRSQIVQVWAATTEYGPYERMWTIEFTRDLLDSLITLSPHLPENLLKEVLNCIRIVPDEEERSKTLINMARKVGGGYHEPLRLVAQEIEEVGLRVATLAALEPPADEEPSQMEELVDPSLMSRSLSDFDTEFGGGHEDIYEDGQPDQLTQIVTKWKESIGALPVAEQFQIVAEEIKPRLMGGHSEPPIFLNEDQLREKSRALAKLTLVLSHCAPEVLDIVWTPILQHLLMLGRPTLLQDIAVLVPIVRQLGQDESLLETILAIEDVGRWWP